MKRAVITCAVILFLSLIVASVSAETWTTTGGNDNGQYTATLYVDESGNMALALAGVVQGTLDPATPFTSPQGPLAVPAPGSTGVVSQDYTLNAQNGQGFAGCSVVDAQGNTAGTSLSVESGQATVRQAAGFGFPDLGALSIPLPVNMVYAGQIVDDGSYGNSIAAQTFAKTPSGNTAGVYVTADGTMYVIQEAFAVEGTWDPEYENIEIILNGAFAAQAGDVGSGVVNNGFAGASGLDYLGNFAQVGSHVDDGYMVFDQEAVAGDLLIVDSHPLGSIPYLTYTIAEAWQDVEITGMYGKTYSESYNPGDLNHTYAKIEYDNRGLLGSGPLNEPVTSGSSIDVASDAEAGFISVYPLAGNLGKELSGYYAESSAMQTYQSEDLQNYCAEGYGRNQISTLIVTSTAATNPKFIYSRVDEDGIDVTVSP